MMSRAAIISAALLIASCGSGKWKPDDRSWSLPGFQFDLLDGGNIVYVDGTLQGPDVGYKENTWSLRCVRNDMKCQVAHVEEIGRDQLSRIEQYEQNVSSWNDTTVVLRDDEDTSACATEIITLNLPAKTASYDSIAKNQDKLYCKRFGATSDHHWKIAAPVQPWERKGSDRGAA